MKKIFTWTIVGFGSLFIMAFLSYYFVPYVRYKLIPITGGTKAPVSLDITQNLGLSLSTLFASTEPVHEIGHDMLIQPGIFANKHHQVSSIDQVPEAGGWINSTHLDLKKLEAQNKFILIDFWTYSCINCIRATPYTQELWDRYKDHGLVVIGIHSPEFKFEGNPKNIYAAVKKAGITYPVLTDASKLLWHRFGNHFWPGKYLISPEGNIIHTQFGEGKYDYEEQVIRKHLQQAGWKLPPYTGTSVFLEPSQKTVTPELYAGVGFLRQPYGNSERPAAEQVTKFSLPAQLISDSITLDGSWYNGYEHAESRSDGQIVLNYTAQAPYIVLDGVKPSMVEVLLDGQPVTKKFAGEDMVNQDSRTFMKVNEPRLYYPIAHKAPYGRHTITFRVPAGIRLYSFTFGVY